MKYLSQAFIIGVLLYVELANSKILTSLNNSRELTVKEGLRDLVCKPLTISDSGPLPLVSEQPNIGKEITISIGRYKFIRSDVGNPDGELKVYRDNRLLCHIETSILTGIKIVPKDDTILLKSSSGSGSNWEIFKSNGACKSTGFISDKNFAEFEMEIGKIKNCQTNPIHTEGIVKKDIGLKPDAFIR